MRKLLFSCLLSLLGLVGCENPGVSLNSWQHANAGSYSAAFSPDGRFLFTGSINGFGRVWDIDANKVIYSLQHEKSDQGGIVAAAFSANGEAVATIERQTLARWSMQDGELMGFWGLPDLTDIAISADARFALLGSRQYQAIYFDMDTGKVIHAFPHKDKVNSVALSADGRFALTGADDFNVSLWDLKTGKRVWTNKLNYKISTVALSDDGNYAFANAFVGVARIYSTSPSGELVAALPVKKYMTITAADFSDDGLTLATGRANKGIDIWDVRSGERKQTWMPEVRQRVQPDASTILALHLEQGAKTLLSESATGMGQRWQLQ